MLIDTHCHIHEADYPLDVAYTLRRAQEAGVGQLICVGTSLESSRLALAFADDYPNSYASIGVHPHDTSGGWEGLDTLAAGVKAATDRQTLVAVGEIGLDYFYTHSLRQVQIEALQAQMQLARDLDLPIIFHVRDAFDDFWPIFDTFAGIRGVLHSFTDTQANMEAALGRGLSIGVNGISTFTRDDAQKAMFASIPLKKLLLETDAPFLTPHPLRGKVNEPAFVEIIAKHHALIRGVDVTQVADATTANARALFAL